MSLQISPWSTHEKNFRAAVKKKSVPKSTRKIIQPSIVIQPEPLIIENIPKVSQTMALTVTQYVKANTEPQQKNIPDDQQKKVVELTQDLEKEKNITEKLLEQKVVLSYIQQDLIKRQAIALLLPIIKQKSTQLSSPRLNNISFKDRTTDNSKEIVLSDQNKLNKHIANLKRREDKIKSHDVAEYDPFDDNEIMKRGLAFLRSQKEAQKKRAFEDVSIKIKRR